MPPFAPPALEPLDRLVLGDAVLDADARLARLPPRDAEARPLEAHVEVHAINARRRVVLDAEVDVLRHAEAEVARRAEVLALELVLLDLEAALENLRRLLASYVTWTAIFSFLLMEKPRHVYRAFE